MFTTGDAEGFAAPSIAVLVIPIFMWRLLNEEKVLRRDLSGYVEYCRSTRYWHIPFVW